jgi:hypothetical protein
LYARFTEAICLGDNIAELIEATVAEVQIEKVNQLFQANCVISGCLARPKVHSDSTTIVVTSITYIL